MSDLFTATIFRFKTSDEGTLGTLVSPLFSCFTLELPWRDNAPCLSCIPPGNYVCVPHKWRGRIKAFKLLGVPKRSNILIHYGNYAGDVNKGLFTHSEGCILVGKYVKRMHGQLAVLRSRLTLSELISKLGFKEFELIIKEVY